MCRNIRTLYNFDPPATDDEIRAAALQYVRKISGFTHPSQANQAAFERAVDEIARVSEELLLSLKTVAPPKNRDHRRERCAHLHLEVQVLQRTQDGLLGQRELQPDLGDLVQLTPERDEVGADGPGEVEGAHPEHASTRRGTSAGRP